MRRFFIKVVFSFFLSALLVWLYLLMPQSFLSFDNFIKDFMFLSRGEISKNANNVVIVDIDEKALNNYGQWPWSRDIFAQLLYNLSDAGVGIVGLDIIFSENDRTSPHLLAKKFPLLKNRVENYDEVLAQALMQTPVIGGYVFDLTGGSKNETPNNQAIFIEKFDKELSSFLDTQESRTNTSEYILKSSGLIANIPTLQEAFYSSGFVNAIPDVDGKIRSVSMLMNYDGMLYPSLSLEMLRIYAGVKKVEVISSSYGIDRIKIGSMVIPTDQNARLIVNFRGAKKHFHYISASDILDGTFDPKEVAGKFVLVGTSALGLHDIRSIVYDRNIPGVEIHANVIDNILEQDYLTQPMESIFYNILIIIFITFFFMFVLSFLNSWLSLPFSIVVIYGMFYLFEMILFEYGIVLNYIFAFVAYGVTFIASIAIDYIITSRQKEQAKRMLGKKVSPAVMEYLLEHSAEELVASKDVEATIFFSDIRSFTTISEKIGSPQKLIEMLNTYMTPMVDSIVEHQGTIDKFIGDAIMAYWNAPIEVKNHADVAVQSAIEQIEKLSDINKEITPKYDVEIAIGIGVHTGIVTAGDMGSEGRSDYTIIGDNVNLASRLEGLTKQYGAQILISYATYSQLKGRYKIRPIDLVEVKGKSEAVEIYEVICSNKTIEDEEMQLYLRATEYFREGSLKEASKIYKQLQSQNPSLLYSMYVKRTEEFLNNPQKEFTPILKMTTK